MTERRAQSALLALVVLACVVRVWLVFSYNPMSHIGSDPGRHWQHGISPTDTSPMSAIDPIGYQLYLGALAKLTVQVPILVAYWTALLSIVGPWLWYRFLRELLPQKTYALAGWAILAALPSWSSIYSYFMQETLMLPLLGAALWASWRCKRKADVPSFLIAAALWLMAGLTRGICLPLGFVTMVALWLQHPQKLQRALLSAMLVGALLGPLAGRSWSLVRQFSPHGLGTMVQLYHRAGTQGFTIEFARSGGRERWNYVFTSPAVLEAPFRPFSEWRSPREWTAHFSIDLDAGPRDWDAEMAKLPPWSIDRAARLTADNLVLLFFSSSWPDNNAARVVDQAGIWLRWVWAPITLICLGLTVVRWRLLHGRRLLFVLLMTWLLFQGFFPLAVNEGRYRKPFEGLLVAQCLLLASAVRASRQYERANRGKAAIGLGAKQ